MRIFTLAIWLFVFVTTDNIFVKKYSEKKIYDLKFQINVKNLLEHR